MFHIHKRMSSSGTRRRPVHPAKKTRAYESGTRARSKEETRGALIDAALSLFAEKGLDAPTIDEISGRAGFTRGAFYAHFGDRDALMIAALGSRRRATLAKFLDELGDEPSVNSLLQLFGHFVAAGVFPPKEGIRSPEFLQACRRSSELRHAQLGLLRETSARLAALVGRDQASGAVRRDVDAAALGTFLVVLEAGVEIMADLGWKYDVAAITMLISRLIAAPPSAVRGR